MGSYTPPWERRRALQPVANVAPGTGGRSPYRLGRDFERSCRGQLERRAWFVQRSQGSKGVIDLLAVGRDRPPLFIQCKRQGNISSGEWNVLYALAVEFGGWPVVAFRESPRTTAWHRIDDVREPRKRDRPWTRFDPTDLRELHEPLTLPV